MKAFLAGLIPADRKPFRHPALGRMKRNLACLDHPFSAFLATELPGLEHDFEADVRDAEAEGARLMGATPCPMRHGIEIPEYLRKDLGRPFLPIPGPCHGCGAAL